MVCKGIAKGKMIELEETLPYREGEPLHVLVRPVAEAVAGTPAAILQAMHQPPHLTAEDVDELEREIEISKLDVSSEGVFDTGM